MTGQTLRHRSALVRAAERELDDLKTNTGDYILAAVGIVGVPLILILNALGVLS